MRLLHTADWHLGARFHDQRRAEEEDDALEQVIALCRERDVDAVIVAGDVFDNANPRAADERRYYLTLARLVRDAGVATVVVVAGNHDSALRLEGPRELARAMGVHVVGRFGRDATPEDAVVPLLDRDGKVSAVCATLPYLRDGDLRLPDYGESQQEIHERYAVALAARYAEVRDAARGLHPDVPLVVTGHCHVVEGIFNSDVFGGEERSVQIGGLSAVKAESLAGNASYLALGHLHRPQMVDQEHWRYSGSLLPTGFDETNTHREVVLFDLSKPRMPAENIQCERLAAFRSYRRLRGTVNEIEHQIDDLKPATSENPSPWCEALVVRDGPHPGLRPALVERAQDRGWSLLSVRIDQEAPKTAGKAGKPAALDLRELDPQEVFIACHRAKYETDPSDELLDEFRDLMKEVESGGADTKSTSNNQITSEEA